MTYNKDPRAAYDKSERGGYLRETTDARTVRPEAANTGKPKQAHQPHRYDQNTGTTQRQEMSADTQRPDAESAHDSNQLALFFAFFWDKKHYGTPVFAAVAGWALGWDFLYAVAGVVLIFKILVINNLINFIRKARLVQARVVSNDSATSPKWITTVYEFQTPKGLERASFRSADKRAFDSEWEPVVYNPANPQHIMCVDVLPDLVRDYIYKSKRVER